jgi:hypothetical protein
VFSSEGTPADVAARWDEVATLLAERFPTSPN